ncbi:MAG: ABC transporter ATP-binding protein [Burkholderiales bacterium]|nr:ABC transporter ATP-binding protein [Burkholderiales bacterium]OJX07501.1 MAG: ABC transporter ATP-binding protein [Burkholderiales bacterium 70-64]
MLSVEKINAGYGHLRVLQDVDLNVRQGELVCVIGPNGAGKTTLLRSICGMSAVGSGAISFDGRTIRGLGPSAVVACGIAMVPEGRRVFGPLTVKENLLLGAYLRRGPAQRAEVRRDLEGLYETFPILGKRENQMAGLLSGGEQQMLAIARAMMSRPKLLLLDEPSMGLAPLIVRDIFRVLDQLRGRVTILLVEQNARIALQLADRGYVLERGKVVSGGSRDDLLKDDFILKTYLGTSGMTRH